MSGSKFLQPPSWPGIGLPEAKHLATLLVIVAGLSTYTSCFDFTVKLTILGIARKKNVANKTRKALLWSSMILSAGASCSSFDMTHTHKIIYIYISIFQQHMSLPYKGNNIQQTLHQIMTSKVPCTNYWLRTKADVQLRRGLTIDFAY